MAEAESEVESAPATEPEPVVSELPPPPPPPPAAEPDPESEAEPEVEPVEPVEVAAAAGISTLLESSADAIESSEDEGSDRESSFVMSAAEPALDEPVSSNGSSAPGSQSRTHPDPVVAPPPPPPIEAPQVPVAVAPSVAPPVPPPLVASNGHAPPALGSNGTLPPPPPPPAIVPVAEHVDPTAPPVPMAPPEPAAPAEVIDPYQLGPASQRLSAAALRTGRVSLGILSMVLEADEVVESLVGGRYQNQAGAAALTNKRLVLVNEHEWVPEVRTVPITADLVVQGWQDDRTASLIFITEGQSVTFSFIIDRPLAQEMAQLVRARVSELTPDEVDAAGL